MRSAPRSAAASIADASGSMNRLTRTPRPLSSATTGFRRTASRPRSQPWSEVKAPVSSGTRVHCAGRASRANSIKPWKGLPSMLNSAPGYSRTTLARSRTSFARTCRPSGRGWTVIPLAPASSAMRAARTTLGIPIVRVLRSKAILLRLTLRNVTAATLSQREQIPEDLAAPERLIVEAVIDEGAHQDLGLLLRRRIGVIVASHVEERSAGDDRLAAAVFGLDRPALRVVAVALHRIDRAAARAVEFERHRVPE